MLSLRMYQVDAFTSECFGGNPAAVVVLQNKKWVKDKVMLNIAKENNIAETAYCYKVDHDSCSSDGPLYKLRWFTPEIEMDLCGHATLATSHVLFNYYEKEASKINFYSEFSGNLQVSKRGDGDSLMYEMLLPRRPPESVHSLPDVIERGMGFPKPKEIFKNRDYLLVYENESDVKSLNPNETVLNEINLDPGGIIATARADSATGCDFVSRFFTPQCTVFEDPVTGSAHCTLIPFWSKKLHKDTMIAKQISPRLGTLYCQDLNQEFVSVAGKAVTFFVGDIFIGNNSLCQCQDLDERSDTNVKLCSEE